jgi:hypothetical protein
MKALIPLFPFVAAIGLLACQRDDGPVANGATAPPDSVVGDAGSSGIATPANAAAAEAADRAAVPFADNGMVWSSSASGAGYGPAGTPPLLSFACVGSDSARRLTVTRLAPSHAGATGTLSFTGGGHASSMPMHAVAKPGAPGESEWQGEARGDDARAVSRAFENPGVVNITLGGAPALAVPSSPMIKALLVRCS